MPTRPVQHFPASQVTREFGVGALSETAHHRVMTARRTEPGEVELHEHENDVFYILAGEATFITGGTMLGKRQTEPGQWRGVDIQGGDVYQLKQGDVILIPAGIPHWFESVPTQIDYFVVKVIH